MHQPRHLSEPARLFGPDYLEVRSTSNLLFHSSGPYSLLNDYSQVFSRTQWYIVPLIWLPIALNLFVRSLVGFSRPLPHFLTAPFLPFTAPYIASITPNAITYTIMCFLLGNVLWTILEYTLHRFLFHIDDLLPDKPVFLTLHFLMHGIHHYLPMDR